MQWPYSLEPIECLVLLVPIEGPSTILGAAPIVLTNQAPPSLYNNLHNQHLQAFLLSVGQRNSFICISFDWLGDEYQMFDLTGMRCSTL